MPAFVTGQAVRALVVQGRVQLSGSVFSACESGFGVDSVRGSLTLG
jgi:hypothetical protein